MGVEVRDLSINEIDTFYQLYHKAEIKHGFSLFSKPYFEQFLRNYPKIASMKLAYIQLDDHIHLLKQKSQEVQQKIEGMLPKAGATLSRKKQNKLQEQQIIYDKLQENISEAYQLRSDYGDTLNLASAIFAQTKDELVYLFSGSDPKFNKFMGNYVLQWKMIQHAKRAQIDRYNFYGITGDFTPDAKDYGVLQFKKGFGGYVEELVGDFICPTRPLLYRLYQLKQSIKK
ncbi:peptidoglycan bridge formation glycyltransferase FemA/FemB family protein [Staphylococcus chromogenes]|nr:peptidoglycan bridge formation glycyltransferase FemA/FemB family protein [Staphylococcus chromogenes]MDU0428981.1 peptidoglycan bridge formation glycyltransferase FemA/FemB family protein [Staphylococcus chromogenes]